MRVYLAQASLCLAVATAQTGPSDWQTATELPNVDFTGLTPAQKKAALTVLRGESCVCGCGMHVAECRIKDPSCGDSRALAQVIVKAIRDKADPQKAVAESPVMKRRTAAPALLEEAIALPVTGAPSKGPSHAKITLVEFS